MVRFQQSGKQASVAQTGQYRKSEARSGAGWPDSANPGRRQVVPRGTYPEEVATMLKFLGGTMGIIFLIGLVVVIGIFSLIF
jgi:hypothetical protein